MHQRAEVKKYVQKKSYRYVPHTSLFKAPAKHTTPALRYHTNYRTGRETGAGGRKTMHQCTARCMVFKPNSQMHGFQTKPSGCALVHGLDQDRHGLDGHMSLPRPEEFQEAYTTEGRDTGTCIEKTEDLLVLHASWFIFSPYLSISKRSFLHGYSFVIKFSAVFQADLISSTSVVVSVKLDNDGSYPKVIILVSLVSI